MNYGCQWKGQGEKNARLRDSSALHHCREQRGENALPRMGTLSCPPRDPKQSRFHKDKWVAGVGQRH